MFHLTPKRSRGQTHTHQSSFYRIFFWHIYMYIDFVIKLARTPVKKIPIMMVVCVVIFYSKSDWFKIIFGV